MQGHLSLSIIGEAWPLQLKYPAGACQLGPKFERCLCAKASIHFSKFLIMMRHKDVQAIGLQAVAFNAPDGLSSKLIFESISEVADAVEVDEAEEVRALLLVN